jgi:hypothetical protein
MPISDVIRQVCEPFYDSSFLSDSTQQLAPLQSIAATDNNDEDLGSKILI